jgi:hypothetical protein
MVEIPPELLTALATAAKDKAVGAAVDLVFDAAKETALKLRGLLPTGNVGKQHAAAIVDRVLAEMAAFPPDRAIVVEPLATIGDVGIWAPRGRLSVAALGQPRRLPGPGPRRPHPRPRRRRRA